MSELTRRELAAWLAVAIAAGVVPEGPSSATSGRADLSMVDEELRSAAEKSLATQPRTLSAHNLVEIRNSWQPAPPMDSPAIEIRSIPGLAHDPNVRIEIIGAGAKGGKRSAILNIHGGGYVLGRARHATRFCQKLAFELDCVVVNVDYRLAPESQFPGPLNDVYSALLWLHLNAVSLGADPDRIAVVGVSAGGGLAAMLTRLARDRNKVPIRCQVLMYPMLDDRTGSTHLVTQGRGNIVWTANYNRFGWTSLLGVPAGATSAPTGAVPARFGYLGSLPPAFIGVGDLDLFAEEDIDYARRLVHAGVPTTLLTVPGAFHAFDDAVPDAQVSRMFASAWKNFLRRTLSQ